MSAKAYKRWKLAKENGVFVEKFKSPTNPHHVVIDESLAAIYNENTKDSGVLYELDVEASKEVEKDINKRMAERIARQTRTTYNPDIVSNKQPEKKIHIMEFKDDKNDIHESEIETPDQMKYNKRKYKMISAGWNFDSENNTFSKNAKTIQAEDLLNMSNPLYGKLLK